MKLRSMKVDSAWYAEWADSMSFVDPAVSHAALRRKLCFCEAPIDGVGQDLKHSDPHEPGKSAQDTLNPIFPRAGGTLFNQGTLMTRSSLRHKLLCRNSGFRAKMGELVIRNCMVMENEIRRMNEAESG